MSKRDEFVPFDSDLDGEYNPEYPEQDKPQQETLDDVRGQSDLRKQKKVTQKGQKALVGFLIFLGILIACFMAYRAYTAGQSVVAKQDNKPKSDFSKPTERTFGDQFKDKEEDYVPFEATEEKSILDQVETETPPTESVESVAVEPPTVASEPELRYEPQPTVNVAPPPPPTDEELREERIYRSGFSIKSTGSSGSGNGYNNVTIKSGKKQKDPLVESLSPADLKGSSAVQMQNRDMIITKGNMIDCVLDTKFNSTVVGMLSCTVTRNIYSASGRVVLIDRGSRVTGQYKGGLTQGQNRVFVVWDRVETPKGVIIDLDSPGASSLGESGLTGRVDNKFWARFGGAIMVSLITDFGKAISEVAAEKTIGGNVTLENTSDTATEMSKAALEKSINIPPSLIKHQGDKLTIYVARDLYFGDVYDLTVTD